MFNIQDFKNASLIGYKLKLIIDDTNEDNTFGFTESVEKVTYNLKKINETFKYKDIDNRLENSETGLTTLFPVGRYIAIVELKKDKSKMRMTLIDLKTSYSAIDNAFDGVFSENIKVQFKKMKYEVEDFYNDSLDFVELNTVLEPAN